MGNGGIRITNDIVLELVLDTKSNPVCELVIEFYCSWT